jgi:hypothetical protein
MQVVSQQTVGSIYSNTPFTQALCWNGPQFQTHSARAVILEIGILQNPGETASLSNSTTEGLLTEEQLLDKKVFNLIKLYISLLLLIITWFIR